MHAMQLGVQLHRGLPVLINCPQGQPFESLPLGSLPMSAGAAVAGGALELGAIIRTIRFDFLYLMIRKLPGGQLISRNFQETLLFYT